MAKKSNTLSGQGVWIVTGFLVLIILVVAYTTFEYRENRKEIVNLLQDKGKMVSGIILRSGIMAHREAQNRLEERLQEQAKQLLDQDNFASPDEFPLPPRLNEKFPSRVMVYDAQFIWRNSTTTLPRYIERHLAFISRKVQNFYTSGKNQEPLFLPLRKNHPRPEDAGLLIRRNNGKGVFVLFPEQRRGRVRRTDRFNLQNLVENLIENMEITYIIFKRGDQMLAFAGSIDSIDLARTERLNDGFQLRNVNGKRIFEYYRPGQFPLEDRLAVWVGLPADALDLLNTRLFNRVLISTLIFVCVATLAWVFLLNRQKYQLLTGRYEEIKFSTGNILENMTEGIIGINPEGKISLVNTSARKLLTIQTGVMASELKTSYPEIADLVSEFKNVKNLEITLQLGRKPAVISITSSTIRGNKDRILTYILLFRDITEYKRLQERITREDKINAMGKLASGVAHEIRNPLNAIGMNIQRISSEFSTAQDKSEFNQLTQATYNEVQRVNQIIESFLEFARMPHMKPIEVNLSELLIEISVLMTPAMEQNGIKLEVDIQPDIFAQADPDRLKQAMLNLLRNAHEASSKGDNIDLAMYIEDRYIHIDIADSGRGISTENHSKIFDLYFTTKENGTGLGLSMSQQIINAHHGHIDVDSPYLDRRGKWSGGSRFSIKIPAYGN